MSAMKPRTALLAGLACLLCAGPPARAADGVDISYANGLLTIRCAQAGLGEVLEKVGSATGMEVFLDDAVKGALLTVDVRAQPVSLALERVLEGQGVTYAMSLSPDGQRASRMYVGTAAGSAGSPSVVRGRPSVRRRAGHAAPAAEVDEDEADLADDSSPFPGLAQQSPITFEALIGAANASGLPPILDPSGRPIAVPQASPPAPPTQEKPAAPGNP
jgi:hypothetical protein